MTTNSATETLGPVKIASTKTFDRLELAAFDVDAGSGLTVEVLDNTGATLVAAATLSTGANSVDLSSIPAATTEIYLKYAWDNSGDSTDTAKLDSYTVIAAGFCGNGIPNGAEACDDGNNNAGDGCDASCNVETVSYTHLTLPTKA